MRDLSKFLDNLLQWIRYLIVAILALLVILKAMLMCGQMHIGIIPCVFIAIGLFAITYGLYWLCFYYGGKHHSCRFF